MDNDARKRALSVVERIKKSRAGGYDSMTRKRCYYIGEISIKEMASLEAALQPPSPMGDDEIIKIARKHGLNEDHEWDCEEKLIIFARAVLSRATPAEQKVGEE